MSRFLGIVIAMYHREHLPAHFHARYGGYEIMVEIETGVLTGRFPRRALNHVLEWLDLHRDELQQNWLAASNREPLRSILPLE